jgi:hypothetical protein
MQIQWPAPFPGAYWLNEREGRAFLDVLRRRALFRKNPRNDRPAPVPARIRPGRDQIIDTPTDAS